jgi:hypothetical protein
MLPASGERVDEFEDHFLLRKVALGDCHRPYGTPCVHKHACARRAGSSASTLNRSHFNSKRDPPGMPRR